MRSYGSRVFMTAALVLALALASFGGAERAASADLPAGRVSPLSASPLLVCKSGCQYSTIGAAVSASNSGDEIHVAQGTYNEKVQVQNKSLTILGGYSKNWGTRDPATYETTINGGGSGRVVSLSSSGGHTGTLDGFTITGGKASDYGGGILVKGYGATISHNHIVDNRAPKGGGIAVRSSSGVVIENNLIEENTVTVHAGGIGIYDSTVSVTGNQILNNTATDDGGGLTISGATVVVDGNTIKGNKAQGYGGGGLMVRNGSDVTITNNTISRNYGERGGGGMRIDVSEATLQGNRILRNTTDLLGGGLAVVDSHVDVKDNDFKYNKGGTGGGGMQFSSGATGLITGNRIMENDAGSNPGGGGVHFWRCGPRLVSNIISNNTSDHAAGGVNIEEASPRVLDNEITDNYAGDHGGGISVSAGSTPIIEGNLIARNTARVTGGGLFSWTSSPQIRFNEIVDNEAPTSGGVHLTGSIGFEVTNNIIARNKATVEGGGIELMSNSQGNIINNTLVNNNLGAGAEAINCRNNSHPRIANNIMVGQKYGVRAQEQAKPTVEYNDVWNSSVKNYDGVSSGPGAISCDPHFVNASAGDYHLTPGSCVIDNGTANGAPTSDFDGDPRPVDGDGDRNAAWDMGADEYFNPVWVTKDVNNQFVDPGDPVTFTIAYRNNAASSVSGVVITDDLNEITDWLVDISCSHTGPNLEQEGNDPYLWTVPGGLDPGEEGTITIKASVDPSLSIPQAITNRVTFEMNGYGPFEDEVLIMVGGRTVHVPAVSNDFDQ
jgi:uncharacterized repeat protein (TIGR01451 family)